MACRSVWFCNKCGRENVWGRPLCIGCRKQHTSEERRWICCGCRTDNPWEKRRCEACQHKFDGPVSD